VNASPRAYCLRHAWRKKALRFELHFDTEKRQRRRSKSLRCLNSILSSYALAAPHCTNLRDRLGSNVAKLARNHFLSRTVARAGMRPVSGNRGMVLNGCMRIRNNKRRHKMRGPEGASPSVVSLAPENHHEKSRSKPARICSRCFV
jgi:hypothetical protein